MKRIFLVLSLVLCLASGMVRADTKPLTVGTLPVIQALPLFVAAEEGLFQAEGVDVQLVPFRMAMEKDVAMTTGGIDVNFGDLFTAIFLKNGGTDIRILARNTSSLEGARMFGIVAAPQSKLTQVTDLAGVPVAVSSNTIIEYVTRRIETRAGVGADQIQLIEVKDIPVRLQMLLAGQVQAATMPEPLVTLAQTKGGRVLADDAGTNLSSTVLMAGKTTIADRKAVLVRFFKALNKAALAINGGGPKIREIMNRSCNVPAPLRESYPIPRFLQLAVPSEEEVKDAVTFLGDRGLLKAPVAYVDLVDGGLIP